MMKILPERTGIHSHHNFPKIIIESRIESTSGGNDDEEEDESHQTDKKSYTEDDSDQTWDHNHRLKCGNTHLQTNRSMSISPKLSYTSSNGFNFTNIEDTVRVMRNSPTTNILLDVSPNNLSNASSLMFYGNSPGCSRAISPIEFLHSNSPNRKNQRSYSQPSECSSEDINNILSCECKTWVICENEVESQQTMGQTRPCPKCSRYFMKNGLKARNGINRKYSLNFSQAIYGKSGNYTQASPNALSHTSSGFDFIVDNQTIKSKVLHTLNSKKFNLKSSQSAYDLRENSGYNERKISLPVQYEDGYQLRHNSRKHLSRKKSVTSIRYSSNYFGVIEVSPYLHSNNNNSNINRKFSYRKTSSPLNAPNTGSYLAAPIIRSRSRNCHQDLMEEKLKRKSDLSYLLSSASSSEVIPKTKASNSESIYSKPPYASSEEKKHLEIYEEIPNLSIKFENENNRKIVYCRLFMLLVSIQLLVGSSMTILGFYLWHSNWNLNLVECSHWAAMPLFLTGVISLIICYMETKSIVEKESIKATKITIAIFSIFTSILCITTSIFSGYLSDQIGNGIGDSCKNINNDCACFGVRNFTNTSCDIVHANLKDYLILQCTLLGLAAGVSIWLSIILIRNRLTVILREEDEDTVLETETKKNLVQSLTTNNFANTAIDNLYGQQTAKSVHLENFFRTNGRNVSRRISLMENARKESATYRIMKNHRHFSLQADQESFTNLEAINVQ